MRYFIILLIGLFLLQGCDHGTRAQFKAKRPWLQEIEVKPVKEGEPTLYIYKDKFQEYEHGQTAGYGRWYEVKGWHKLTVDQNDRIVKYDWQDEQWADDSAPAAPAKTAEH